MPGVASDRAVVREDLTEESRGDRVVRSFGLAVLSVLLFVVLSVGLSLGAAAYRASDRDSVKDWLRDPSLHEEALVSLPVFLGGDTSAPGADENGIAAVVLGEALTYDAYLRLVDGGVDAAFDWLVGGAPPVLEVALTDDPAALQERVLAATRERVLALPPCSEGQLPEDLLAAGCRPAGLDMAALDREIVRALGTGRLGPVFEEGVVRAGPVDTAAPAAASRVYTVARWAPVLLVAAVLILLAMAQVAIRDRRRGARFAGLNLLVASVAVAAGLALAFVGRPLAVEVFAAAAARLPEELAALVAAAASNALDAMLGAVGVWTLVAAVIAGALLVYAHRGGPASTAGPP